MNDLIRQDLIDLAKVNIPGWSIVVWIKNWDIQALNAMVQDTGQSLLIMFMVVYTGAKLFKLVRDIIWAKQDRAQNTPDNA